MADGKKLDLVIVEAKKYFSDSAPTHDWDHVCRVHALCMHIGKVEGADLGILACSSYLHDIGRCFEEKDSSICHARKGADMSYSILDSLGYDQDFIDAVVHCVRTHRFRNDDAPVSLEARVLYDSDKLDAIGAIGVARAYAYAGEHRQKLISDFDALYGDSLSVDHLSHTPIKEYIVKLSKIKDRMLTTEGKRLAHARDEFMRLFYERLRGECSGEV